MARLLHGGHGLFGRPLYGDRHRPRLPDHHGDVGVEGEAAQARRDLVRGHVAVRGQLEAQALQGHAGAARTGSRRGVWRKSRRVRFGVGLRSVVVDLGQS